MTSINFIRVAQKLFLLALILTALSLPEGLAQNNSVIGKVVLPLIKKKIEVKRGRNYRNRLKSKKDDQQPNEQITKATNTVISLEPIDFEVAFESASVDLMQKGKSFIPHVVAISKGSIVRFINEDKFYHNVFSLSPGARFNIGRRKPGKIVSKTFQNSGIVKIFCDVHPQMNAYILCLNTPYFAKVKNDGTYVISDLPDGKYKIHFFNPALELGEQIIELSGGAIIEKNFIISPEHPIGSIEYEKRWLVGACCNGTTCTHSD